MNYEIGNIEGFKHVTDHRLHNISIDANDVCSMWKMCTSNYSNNIAIEFEETKLTYKQLDDQVSMLRSAMKEYGCKKGDKIAILATNSIDCVRSFLAVVTLGCVAVMLPPNLDYNKIKEYCDNLGLSAIVYQHQFNEMINKLKSVFLTGIFIESNEKSLSTTPIVDVQVEEPCVIMFTGGTTGKQKGAILSHKAVVNGAING